MFEYSPELDHPEFFQMFNLKTLRPWQSWQGAPRARLEVMSAVNNGMNIGG